MYRRHPAADPGRVRVVTLRVVERAHQRMAPCPSCHRAWVVSMKPIGYVLGYRGRPLGGFSFEAS
eukprot:4523540-Pyramimonas_sp.AAC.1